MGPCWVKTYSELGPRLGDHRTCSGFGRTVASLWVAAVIKRLPGKPVAYNILKLLANFNGAWATLDIVAYSSGLLSFPGTASHPCHVSTMP